MSRKTRLAILMYSWLIRLYPVSFREEFGSEMTAVYSEKLTDAARVNQRGLLVIVLRELRDFPISLLRQHWRKFAQLESDLMTTYKKPNWLFYLAWIVLPTLAIPIAFVLFSIILNLLVTSVGDYIDVNGERRITEDYLGAYIIFPIISLLTGVVQYWLLRRFLPRMGWWVLATAAGWLLGFVLIFGPFGVLAYFRTADPWVVDATFVVMGLSIGVGQWLLLRRRLPRAGWWIVGTAVGWGLIRLATRDSFGPVLLQLVLLGLLPACVTAVTLAWLMNPVTPPEPQGVQAN
jgi:hypothetical protein